jgi:hypothetical protein
MESVTNLSVPKRNTWGLDVNYAPSDGQAPINALNYLIYYIEKFNFRKLPLASLRERFNDLISLIEKTDLSKANMHDSNWRTFFVLCRTFPDLAKVKEGIPLVKVVMNGIECEIPKNVLLSRPCFRKIFDSGTEETANNRIDFNEPSYTAETVKLFLDYLKTDTISPTTETSLPLLELAHRYQLSGLKQIIFSFTEKSLLLFCEYDVRCTKEYWKVFMAWTKNRDIETLIYCIANFLWEEADQIIEEYGKNLSKNAASSDSIINQLDREMSAEVVELFKALKTLRVSGIELTKADQDKVDFIASGKAFTKDTLSSLNLLSGYFSIQLDLSRLETTLDDESLTVIMNQFPNLRHLKIANAQITKIPNAEKLISLNCDKCPELKELDIPAKVVKISHCNSLYFLCVDQATEILLHNVPLETYSFSQVKEIRCIECNFKSLYLPQTKVINLIPSDIGNLNAPMAEDAFFNSTKVGKFYLPEAKCVKLYHCTLPKVIDLGKSEKLEIIGGTGFETVNASAKKVHFKLCKTIKEANLYACTRVLYSDCKRLSLLNAPVAKKIFYSYVKPLPTFKTPKECVFDFYSKYKYEFKFYQSERVISDLT